MFRELNPRVVVEIYDKDLIGIIIFFKFSDFVMIIDFLKKGDDDFLGRFTAFPTYRSRGVSKPGVLEWFSVQRLNEVCE